MAKKRIQTHFSKLVVKPDPAGMMYGAGIFNTSVLDADTEYSILATYLHVFDDGSSTPTFLLTEGEGGAIFEKVCRKFLTVKVEQGG